MNLNDIFKNEVNSTLTSLLALENATTTLDSIDLEIPKDTNYIEVQSSFNFSTINAPVKFFISNKDSFIIEHKMLGETDDIKTEVNEDLLDALKEITSNITGAIANSINAQEDDNIKDVKFSVDDISSTDDCSTQGFTKAIKISVDATNTNLTLYILLDDMLSNYFEDNHTSNNVSSNQKTTSKLINDDESENLKLLLGIELKLSVRLGSKEMLLKDIVKLDLGDIVELDQLVNEPLDILVNGTKIAEGEAVVVNGKFAVKIKNIGSAKERISYLRLSN